MCVRELLETEHELVHARYRISHENRGTIGQTADVFSDFILLDSDLCVWHVDMTRWWKNMGHIGGRDDF